jgi:hypothetical protein
VLLFPDLFVLADFEEVFVVVDDWAGEESAVEVAEVAEVDGGRGGRPLGRQSGWWRRGGD